MTLSDFNAAVKNIAAGKYCCSQVTVTNHEGLPAEVKWQAYIDGQSWTGEHRDPAACLAELRAPTGQEVVDAVGEIPL